MADIDNGIQNDLAVLSSQEWLETNGCGAYASTTMADCHTRRYHGLLVTSLAGLSGRYVLLSHLEATVVLGDHEFQLACNHYKDAVHPKGYEYIVESDYEPCPTVLYTFNGVSLRREIIMLEGEQAVYIRYTLVGPAPELKIQLKPLIGFRDSHALSFENMNLHPKCKRLERGIRMSPYETLPPMYVQYNQALEFYAGPCWEKRVCYPSERERGFEDWEDRFSPGVFEGILIKDVPLVLRVGLDNAGKITSQAIVDEIQRRVAARREGVSDQEQRLRRNAGQFFSREPGGHQQMVAGFPWFGSWGRDTMIALPGLCLYNNQIERGKSMLSRATDYLQNGLLPNTFAGIQGKEAFNSIDASLWFLWAAQEFCLHLGKVDPFAKEIFLAVKSIVHAYAHNETGLTTCDEFGLISSGSANTQYTWMDAKAWGKPVTPRYGYAVEINALWYNAMQFHLQLCSQLRRKPIAGIKEYVEVFPEHFQEKFWMDDLGFCADVNNRFGQDRSLRPNQLFAVSLPFSPLNTEQQRHVVMAVERELFTPYGIRTLSPKHPSYCGRYFGRSDERDATYHQGTVWPWLLGAFVKARLKVSADPKHRVRDLNRKLHRLFNDHVGEYGLGSIAEIFDGDEPHHPRGCFAQAWSVAEILRAKAIMEEVAG